MPYESVGGAFSNAIDESMAQQAALKRQAMMDQLAVRREQDLHEQGQAALAEKKAESLARIEEKERGDTEKDAANQVIGDVADPDLVARAKKYHVPLRLATSQGAGTALPAAAPMPVAPGGGAVTPMPNGPAALPTAQPMAPRYAGTNAQLEAAAKSKEAESLATEKLDLAKKTEQDRIDAAKQTSEDRVRQAKEHDETLAAIAAANRGSRERTAAEERQLKRDIAKEKMTFVGKAAKLSPAQLTAFKDIVKRKTADATNFLPSLRGTGITDEVEQQINEDAYEEALQVGAGAGTGAAPKSKADRPSIVGNPTVRP